MTFIPPFPDLDLRYPLSSTAFYNESREISLKRSALLDRRTSATGVSKATSILRAFTAAMDGWLINPTATYTCSAPQPASASLHSISIFIQNRKTRDTLLIITYLMFAGGSMEGTYSSAMYTRPVSATREAGM